jgi:hypothetical protein
MKYNKELAEQFGIEPGPDAPRELVKVDFIPVPPDVEVLSQEKVSVDATSEDRISFILKEEMEELGMRLEKFGVAFTAPQKQDVIDYAMSRLIGYGGGGAIARRQ